MLNLLGKSNDKIKQTAKLFKDASVRRLEGKFVLEGLRLCHDAVISGNNPVLTLVTQKILDEHSDIINEIIAKSHEAYIISEDVSDRLSDTKNPQGVFCVCKTLDKFDNIDKIKYNGIYVALENVQTPGNLGAAARTAEALGIDGLILSGGCDIYNPKALRASMGSLLRLDIIFSDNLKEDICKCRQNNMAAYAAVPDSDAMSITDIDKSHGIICAIGNEGNGLSDEVINACSERITIPMKGRAESLNAAAAASIIMWELVR